MTFVSISPLFHSIRLVDNSTEHYSTTCKQKQTLFLCIQLQAGITHILGGLESRAWLHKLINIYTHNKKTCVNIRLLFCHKKRTFSGIVYLAYYYGITPRSWNSCLTDCGRNIWSQFYVLFHQGTTALILILAANTGYSAFPLLAFNLAKDKFIPRMFTVRGDRLGYSNGIITLGLTSIILIIVFKGETEHLIPLYAVGVFIPFTLSQTGMMLKWVREKPNY